MPYKDPAGHKRWRDANREKRREWHKQWREANDEKWAGWGRRWRIGRTAWMREQKGDTCAGCGGKFEPHELDFHHRDPASKLFRVSQYKASRATLAAEIAKCDVLCASCHKTAHRALRGKD